MKLFCYLLFCLLITIKVYGQNCQRLDTHSFLNSIRFGDKIPPELIACKNQPHKSGNLYYSDLQINYNSLQIKCRKKYADLFQFLSQPFSISQINTNQIGQILSVEWYSFFDEYQETNTASDTPFLAYRKVYQQLESLFGKPTSLQLPTRFDSLLMKVKGIEQAAMWSCSSIDLKIRVYHGAPEKRLNILHVTIRNRDFDRMIEVEKSLQ